jgi:hypothetical protein
MNTDCLFDLDTVAPASAPLARAHSSRPAPVRHKHEADMLASIVSEACPYLNAAGDLMPEWECLLSRASLSTDFRQARSCYLRKVSAADKPQECDTFELCVAAVVLDEFTDGLPGITGKECADLSVMLRAIAEEKNRTGFDQSDAKARAWFSGNLKTPNACEVNANMQDEDEQDEEEISPEE